MVSHPVKLWKTGSAEDFSLPNRVQTELMCQLEKFLPFQKATQILMLGFKESRLKNLPTKMTMMSDLHVNQTIAVTFLYCIYYVDQ